jgi:hypothetical protein
MTAGAGAKRILLNCHPPCFGLFGHEYGGPLRTLTGQYRHATRETDEQGGHGARHSLHAGIISDLNIGVDGRQYWVLTSSLPTFMLSSKTEDHHELSSEQ